MMDVGAGTLSPAILRSLLLPHLPHQADKSFFLLGWQDMEQDVEKVAESNSEMWIPIWNPIFRPTGGGWNPISGRFGFKILKEKSPEIGFHPCRSLAQMSSC